MIIKKIVFIMVQFFWPIVSFSQNADFNKFFIVYLNDLEKSNTAALYASCKTQAGKAILVFSLNGKKGRIFEMQGNDVINSALINIDKKSISIDASDTQGGLYTYIVIENHAKDLIKLNFKIIFPDNMKAILVSTPNYLCIDKPPKDNMNPE